MGFNSEFKGLICPQRIPEETLQKCTVYEENVIFRTRIQIDRQISFMANNFERY
jgi:hypothetical protein